MKKFLGLIAIAMAVVLLPMSASAESLKTTCDKSCPTTEGKCTSTCTIKVEGNTTAMKTFTSTLEVVGEGVTVKSLTAGEGWTKVSPTDADLKGNSIPLSLVSATGVTEENFTLATFTLELESAAADCTLKLKEPSAGSEITVTIETTTETKTGASLPIAIALVGITGAVVIYATSKKSKKIYKI